MFDELYIDIARSILGEIGLGLNKNHIIYNMNDCSLIQINGKFLAFTFTPNTNFFYDSSNSIVFNPFQDLRTMSILFSYYLKTEQEAGNIETVTNYYFDEDPSDRTRTRIVVKTIDNSYESKYYRNKCLKFCDMILKFGYPMEYEMGKFDLSFYDVEE